MNTVRIFISSNPSNLSAKLAEFSSTATVEAEYGDVLVSGSVLTLAHHGARSGRPCPCEMDNFPEMGIEAIGLSHFDLDTLGGVMAILGIKPMEWEFWQTAAFIDIQGPHKLGTLALTTPTVGVGTEDLLNAFWAWSEDNRLFPPRDGSVLDCTEFFTKAAKFLQYLLKNRRLDEEGHKAIIEAGREWAAIKAALDTDSFVSHDHGITIRQSAEFVNHLYRPDSQAVVGFNSGTGAITVSVPDIIPGFSCGEFLKAQYGPLAGGHAGIGGTPRGTVYSIEDAKALALVLAQDLNNLRMEDLGPEVR